ncbi:hypothetical protein QL285_027082 [Trifolium repens]|nr:hypothetical protein QL285_027081 [Trifolium repens]KAK2428569.1 hypothetical protein QL285_027082 [Trifolium repens]
MPRFSTVVASPLTTLRFSPGSLIHRSARSFTALRTVIRLTPLPPTILSRTTIIGTTWSSGTRIPLAVHPLIPHVLYLLALFNQDLELSDTQWHNRILQFVPQPILESTAHIILIYPIPKEAEETG